MKLLTHAKCCLCQRYSPEIQKQILSDHIFVIWFQVLTRHEKIKFYFNISSFENIFSSITIFVVVCVFYIFQYMWKDRDGKKLFACTRWKKSRRMDSETHSYGLVEMCMSLPFCWNEKISTHFNNNVNSSLFLYSLVHRDEKIYSSFFAAIRSLIFMLGVSFVAIFYQTSLNEAVLNTFWYFITSWVVKSRYIIFLLYFFWYLEAIYKASTSKRCLLELK